jgi:hypothetical protein
VFYIKGTITAYDPNIQRSQTFPQIAINGLITGRLNFCIGHDCALLSVAFHPGALSKFLKLPLIEFVDQRVDAELLLNPEIHHARERMANANSYADLVQIAEEYLWKRIKTLNEGLTQIDKIAQWMSENPSVSMMDNPADESCLSISQFERRFRQIAGISPKLFMCINRFCKANDLKDLNPDLD